MKSQKGILLIEAFLSIVILATATTAVTRSFSYASRVYRTSEHYLSAIQLLGQKMAEIESFPELPAGDSSGTFESPFNDFMWSLTSENLSDAQDSLMDDELTMDYLKVTLTLRWKSPKPEEISIETLMTKKKDNEKDDEDEEANDTLGTDTY